MINNNQNEIEGDVPGFYDLASSWFMVLSRGFSRNLHYRMKRPIETNQVLAELASVTDRDRILDMGCGQGGSVRWLARHFKCAIDAITISEGEVSRVRRMVRNGGLADRVNVFLEDMLATHYPDKSFSLTWAIESMCHVADKRQFVREAYRVLEPGGRIVMADFFLMRGRDEKKEVADYRNFCNGFLVPSLCTEDDFLAILSAEGFRNILFVNHSKAIRDCAREREILGWINPLLISPLSLLKILPNLYMQNSLGMIAQGRLFRHNIISYGVIYAEK